MCIEYSKCAYSLPTVFSHLNLLCFKLYESFFGVFLMGVKIGPGD